MWLASLRIFKRLNRIEFAIPSILATAGVHQNSLNRHGVEIMILRDELETLRSELIENGVIRTASDTTPICGITAAEIKHNDEECVERQEEVPPPIREGFVDATKQVWIGDHGVYELEPRFADVKIRKNGWPDMRYNAGREMAYYYTKKDRDNGRVTVGS